MENTDFFSEFERAIEQKNDDPCYTNEWLRGYKAGLTRAEAILNRVLEEEVKKNGKIL